MKKILIVLMCILLSGVAHAGPFGTSEGDGLDRYPGAESLGDNTYVVYSLPKSHPDFDTFLLTIPEKYGLVKIQALDVYKRQALRLRNAFSTCGASSGSPDAAR